MSDAIDLVKITTGGSAMPESQRLAARWCTMAAVVLLCVSAALAQGHPPIGFVSREVSTLREMFAHYSTLPLVLLGIPVLLGYYLLAVRHTRPRSMPPPDGTLQQSSIPDNITPFQMSAVMAQDDGERNLTAMILRLAMKGYCIIREPRTQAEAERTGFQLSWRRDIAGYPYQTLINELSQQQFVAFSKLSGMFALPEPRIRQMIDCLAEEGVRFEKTDNEVRIIGVTQSFASCAYGLTPDEFSLLCIVSCWESARRLDNSSVVIDSFLWNTSASLWHSLKSGLCHSNLAYFLPGVVFAGLAMWEVIKISGHYLVGVDVQRLGASLIIIGLPLWLYAVFAETLWTGENADSKKTRILYRTAAVVLTVFLVGMMVLGNAVFYVMPFSLFLMTAPYIAIIASFRFRFRTVTERGLRLNREIEAFRQFLTSPGDGQAAVSERTPAQFEQLLPYAIVLGVEDVWYRQFADRLDHDHYRPDWYDGSDWRIIVAKGFFNTIGHYFENYPSGSKFSISDLPISASGYSG